MKMLKNIIGGLIGLVITAYLLVCCAVMFMPQKFFYEPSEQKANLNHAHLGEFPAQEVSYQADDGTQLMAWFIPAEQGQKTIVFMHGNAGNVENFYPKLKMFADLGYGIMMPEYRGFGGLNGKITQKNLEKDMLAAVKYLQDLGYQNADMYIYGMSLGSHMAIHTVHQLQANGIFAGLILEVPFDSLLNVAKGRVPYLPLDWIVADKYDNTKIIQNIQSPILVMGAGQDKVVPIELAKNLFKMAPEPKQILIYEQGQHGNLLEYRNDLDILKWMERNEKSI